MYNPDVFTAAEVQALQDAFTTMSSNDADLAILDDVLSTPGMTIIDTESHLGSYGDAIGDVPGITAYFNSKISKTSSSSSNSDTPWGIIVPSVLIVAGGAVFYFTRVKPSAPTAPATPQEVTSEAPTEE
jgi:hypothetical protein